MADSTTHIISYISDVSNVIANARKLEKINKQLALSLGKDFSRSIDLIDQRFTKLRSKTVFSKKLGKDVIKNFGELTTIVKGVDGQFRTIVQSGRLVGDEFRTTNTTVKQQSVSVNKLSADYSKLIGKSSQLRTNFDKVTDVNKKFNKELSGFGNISKTVGRSINQISSDGTKVSNVFQTTNGKFVQLTETTKRLPEGIQKVSRSVKELSKAQVANIRTLDDNAKASRTFGANLKTLLVRASLTIPVWFALRQSISTVFRTIRDGLKDIADFDRSLQKLRRNISATSNDIPRDFRRARQEIEAFSVESGKSVEEITNAIQRFATVGFDFETSLTGGIQATKLAITLFGDVEQTANAFARSLRVLTADMDTVEEQQTAISEALALTDQLWQTNAFEVNEFSNNLEKFAGTAKIANLSIEDTLTLLATLSTAGLSNRGGRLLRSTILRALGDFENVNRQLNLGLDPNETPTIDFVLKLVGALKDLRVEENVPAELAETLADLFSVRSTEALAGLTALETILKQNIALTPDVKKFEKTFQELNEEITRLSERSTNLNKEIGRTFTSGIVGGENYVDVLNTIIDLKRNLLDDSEALGAGFRNTFLVAGVGSLIVFRKQLLKLSIALAKSPIFLGGVATFTFLDLNEQAKRLAREAETDNQRFVDIGAGIAENINKGIRGNLSAQGLQDVISDIDVIGAVNLGFDEASIARAREKLVLELEIAKAKEQQVEETKKLEKASEIDSQLSNTLLKDQLERLKVTGALESELIKQELLTRKRLGNELEGNALLEKQLQLERAINEERRVGEGVSSDAIKLFQIAQSSGTQNARTISDVLSGEIDFSSFIRRGGEAVDIFKKEFADVFEAEQAKRFFQGLTVAGQPGLRGGSRVNIGDNAQRFDIDLERNLARALRDNTRINDNITALDKNTASLQSLIQTVNSGARLVGPQSGDFVANEAFRQRNIANVASRLPGRQVLDVNVNIDGQNLSFSGTPESIRQLASQVSPQVQQLVENSIVNQIERNPNSKVSKALSNKIIEE